MSEANFKSSFIPAEVLNARFKQASAQHERNRADNGYGKRLDDGYAQPHTDAMSTITREELDAKLAANVAEVKVISAETKAEVSAMRAETRAEMLALRSDNVAMFARLESQMAAMAAKIDASTAQVAGVEKGIEGKIDGLKTSMSTTQWVLGTLIAVAGLAATIVPLLKDSAPPQQPQIVVLQPGAAATPQPTPSKPVKQQPGGN